MTELAEFDVTATDPLCAHCGKEIVHPFDLHVHTNAQAREQLDLMEMHLEEFDHAAAYAARVRLSALREYLEALEARAE